MSKKPLSPTEEQQLIELLGRIEPMSVPVFNALAGALVLTAIELMIFRVRTQREILLIQRPSDDLHWPGMWHIPGTILRASDAPEELHIRGSYQGAFRRLEEKELKAGLVGCPKFNGHYFHRGERGVVHSLLYSCGIDEGGEGAFFPVRELPDNLIDCHRLMIEQGAVVE